jgi:predicted transcriptional regulator
MTRRKHDVTDAELAVLRELWERGPQTIRSLSEKLYPEGEDQYFTVKKLLERLEAKGCVTRDRSEMVHVFRAAIERDDLIDRRLRDVAETLCDGSITPLLTHAARHEQLTKKQRELLQALIDELERKGRRHS